MTLQRLVFAGDVGLGIGHVSRDVPSARARTGTGLNLEAALGVTDRLELGLRTGVRFGGDGRATPADPYGRTLFTETYGTGAETVANPELRARWIAYSGSVTEVSLDARVYLPIEQGTHLGMMFGVPLALHLTEYLRIDTGVYVPVVFNDPAFSAFSFPVYFWFQPTEKLWLGPMAALRFVDPGAGGYDSQLLLGGGLGYQIASAVDLKTWFLFPRIGADSERSLGAGFGVQFRLGE